MRNLVLVLGDQLSLSSVAFDGFDPLQDRIWMAEVPQESDHVPSSKMRTALFLSAMRHFAEALVLQGMPLSYLKLGTHRFASIHGALADTLARDRPRAVLMIETGEWRLEQDIARACKESGVALLLRDDLHFMASRSEFAEFARGKPRLVMEVFYRHMRVMHRVLVDRHGQPEGGQWNFDHDNRGAFGRDGP